MSTADIFILVVAVLLLGLTGYLAAVETVVTRLNVVRALRVAEEGPRGARSLLWLTEHRATVLNSLLVLTVTARIGLAGLATVIAARWLQDGLGIAAVLAVVVVASLVLAEAVPRTAALRHLEIAGLRLAGSARLLVRLVEPFSHLVVALGRGLVPRRHEVSGPYASDDELRQLEGDEEEQDEEIEPEERAMIRSIFELADTVVREIMTPRPDMVTVPEDATFDEVVRTAIERGHSRLPVHHPDHPHAIVGVVYTKDLLRRLALEPERHSWDDLVRAPTFVPESKRCDELLRDLQEEMIHLALVVDEYGELVGLVTIEDILEEIVGEIVDEHDYEDPLVEFLDGGRMRVDARLGVDDLNELLDTKLPEEGWDTVGGLVFATLGRVPIEGETIELERTVIEVERVQGRRVAKVVVSPATPDPVGDEDDDPQRVRQETTPAHSRASDQ